MQVDLSRNYFELFDLPVGFAVDQEGLSLRYRELQRIAHPDRFAAGSDQERRMAVQFASYVNEGFRTLKDPLSRARYLLEQRGIALDEADTRMDPAFLMEQMELREQLESLKGRDDPFGALERLRSDIEKRDRILLEELAAALDHGGDEMQGESVQQVRKLQFLRKLLEEIEDVEEALTHEI